MTAPHEEIESSPTVDAALAPHRTDRSTRIDGGATVNDENAVSGTRSGLISRRNLLRAGVVGAAGVGIAGVAASKGGLAIAANGATYDATHTREVHLAATDGWVTMPKNAKPITGFWPDELAPNPYNMYVFGFRNVSGMIDADVIAQRGLAQISAPTLAFDQGTEIRVTLTNLGLSQRPDLVDGHTMHWHGFNNAIPIFDGVPEMSASVPIGKSITYLYRPTDPGTYMYHCHFEDVEHVQMGMTGIVFVRSLQGAKRAYNDGNGSTNFDREFPILLNEIWTTMHDNDHNIQETVHTDYNPDYFTLNGRVYPQTIMQNNDADLPGQPLSSLVQINAGEKGLLRLANLGYQQHGMQLPGIPLKVVGQDATLLRGRDGTDLSYVTNTLYMGPGDARDVLFTAPPFNANGDVDSDTKGPYNKYFFRNHDARKLANPGSSKLGGMATEVRVYPAGTLTAQTEAGQTYA